MQMLYLKASLSFKIKSHEFLVNSATLRCWNIRTLNASNYQYNMKNYMYVVLEVICFAIYDMAIISLCIQD